MPKRKQPAGLKKYWADKKKKTTKRKTTTRKRRTTRKGDLTLKRKKAYPSKKKANKPRKKSNTGLKLPRIPGFLKKIALGVGAASLAGIAFTYIAPQFAPIARPVAALAAGGIPGVAGELLLNQGLLQNISGMFGGASINSQRLSGGL